MIKYTTPYSLDPGALLCKKFDCNLEKVSTYLPKFWNLIPQEAKDLKEFHEHLKKIAKEKEEEKEKDRHRLAIVLSQVDERKDNVRRVSENFDSHRSKLLVLDLDNLDVDNMEALDAAIQTLPGLENTSYIAQHSGSSMVNGKIKAHIFFELKEEVDLIQIKHWMDSINRLDCDDDETITIELDSSVAHKNHLIYTAYPKFHRETQNPLSNDERIVLIEKENKYPNIDFSVINIKEYTPEEIIPPLAEIPKGLAKFLIEKVAPKLRETRENLNVKGLGYTDFLPLSPVLVGMGLDKGTFDLFLQTATYIGSSTYENQTTRDNLWEFGCKKITGHTRYLFSFLEEELVNSSHSLEKDTEEILKDLNKILNDRNKYTILPVEKKFVTLEEGEKRLNEAMRKAFHDGNSHAMLINAGAGKTREIIKNAKTPVGVTKNGDFKYKRILICVDSHKLAEEEYIPKLLEKYTILSAKPFEHTSKVGTRPPKRHLNVMHIKGKGAMLAPGKLGEFKSLLADKHGIRLSDRELLEFLTLSEYSEQLQEYEAYANHGLLDIVVCPNNYLLEPTFLASFNPELIVVDEDCTQEFLRCPSYKLNHECAHPTTKALNKFMAALANNNKDIALAREEVLSDIETAIEENNKIRDCEENKEQRKEYKARLKELKNSGVDGGGLEPTVESSYELEGTIKNEKNVKLIERILETERIKEELAKISPKNLDLLIFLRDEGYITKPNKLHVDINPKEGTLEGFSYLSLKKIPNCFSEAPIILADATANHMILEEVTGRKLQELQIQIKPHADKEIVQVSDCSYSKKYITDNLEKVKKLRNDYPEAVHIGPKTFKDKLNFHAHHGNTRGSNAFENAKTLFVWGRHYVPDDAVVKIAKNIFCESEDAISGEKAPLPAYQYLVNSTIKTTRMQFANERVRAVFNLKMSETVQSIERIRSIREGKARCVILTRHPLDIMVKKRISNKTLYKVGKDNELKGKLLEMIKEVKTVIVLTPDNVKPFLSKAECEQISNNPKKFIDTVKIGTYKVKGLVKEKKYLAPKSFGPKVIESTLVEGNKKPIEYIKIIYPSRDTLIYESCNKPKNKSRKKPKNKSSKC